MRCPAVKNRPKTYNAWDLLVVMPVEALWKKLLYNKKLLPKRGGSSRLIDSRRVINEKSNPCKREKSGLLRDSVLWAKEKVV